MKGKSPTARSLEYLRGMGYEAEKSEQTLHMPNRPFPMKRDTFGFGDILAVREDVSGALLVQATSAPHIMDRIKKIMGYVTDASTEEEIETARRIFRRARIWLIAGNKIEVHGWAKRGPRGKQKRWSLRAFSLIWDAQNKEIREIPIRTKATMEVEAPLLAEADYASV